MIKEFLFKRVVQLAAKRYNTLDPLDLMARLRSFAQPSEVAEPIELLRAGIVFHARGLVNTKAIQHNLDWIWPYWVEKQFNPQDPSFIPRAFSFSHTNLTHRNWSALGLPNLGIYPIVDPAGLITPFYDSWSIDFWILSKQGKHLFPSKSENPQQELLGSNQLAIRTNTESEGKKLSCLASVCVRNQKPELVIKVNAESAEPAWLAMNIRPYNPEGVQFVDKAVVHPKDKYLTVNGKQHVYYDDQPTRILTSHYKEGDLYDYIGVEEKEKDSHFVECPIGMATLSTLFPIPETTKKNLEVHVPLSEEWDTQVLDKHPLPLSDWDTVLEKAPVLEIPDKRIQKLYKTAVKDIVMHSADDIFPGPYTYKRFWFRDACLIAHSLLVSGFADRVERAIRKFPKRQQANGYYLSQEGEWDSNGQVLWLMGRFYEITDKLPDATQLKQIYKAAKWIVNKRLPEDHEDKIHAGLLPAGFSAEHLGPNDYYYWDNFWGLAGLLHASNLLKLSEKHVLAQEIAMDAEKFKQAIERSLEATNIRNYPGAIPAAPTRRMDAGAIGSMVADYPLQLYPPRDKKIQATLNCLLEKHMQQGAFFQDMIHSGINAYLTLDLAQTLLRNNNPLYRELIQSVADLASPTGHWPEAIHPQGKGGCMGDGHHIWAAAEWVMMIHSCFIQEERDELILCAGVFPEWIQKNPISYGPAKTKWGDITITLNQESLELNTEFSKAPESITANIPGFQPFKIDNANQKYHLQK